MNAKILRELLPDGRILRKLVDQNIGDRPHRNPNCGGELRLCHSLTRFSMNKTFHIHNVSPPRTHGDFGGPAFDSGTPVHDRSIARVLNAECWILAPTTKGYRPKDPTPKGYGVFAHRNPPRRFRPVTGRPSRFVTRRRPGVRNQSPPRTTFSSPLSGPFGFRAGLLW